MAKGGSAEDTIRTIKRKTRRKYSAEEKIRNSLPSYACPSTPSRADPLKRLLLLLGWSVH
jgi:hypothetical protein